MVVLFCVVDLEIREHRNEVRELEARRDSLGNELGSTRFQLRRAFGAIQTDLSKVSKAQGNAPSLELPAPTHPVDDQGSRSNGEDQTDRYLDEVRTLMNAAATPALKSSYQTLVRDVDHYRGLFFKLSASTDRKVEADKNISELR